jgi:hypothetical protein
VKKVTPDKKRKTQTIFFFLKQIDEYLYEFGLFNKHAQTHLQATLLIYCPSVDNTCRMIR